ncbi:MarR family transcriptional regulator [Mycobacterium sp. 21AC1]|uniref:MarR family transcriptional regulator n=1 Tax=[Mycobacterium] appelbergii TaxID=2939269 RepID=UPI00293913FD|nr:MarR family transcriptional regulator [Mycobacterium sp. 21AC1]MDV3129430.1 MarR family transcriptional regulator [Mycobacterium sp. 21AC1]
MKTKMALVGDITELIGVVGDKFDDDEDGDAERDFLLQRCPDRLAADVRSLPTLSMHLLAAIADGPVSVVGLAARSGQLKGTVSKHVQRLVEAGLVTRTPRPQNRKEIELTLSADGELVVELHQQLHDEMNLGFRDFLMRYSTAELHVLSKVLRDLAAARKVGVRLVAAD